MEVVENGKFPSWSIPNSMDIFLKYDSIFFVEGSISNCFDSCKYQSLVFEINF